MEKKLGKGIGALIPDISEPVKSEAFNQLTVSVDKIAPNKYQPRKQFNDLKLKELIESIREKGVIQPVVVREKGDGYEIIAGERRFRAMTALGFKEIPVIVKQAGDADSLEMSLIENIQREELNPIEEASAYKRLVERFGFTQDDVSRAVGKDKSTISNTLKLLTMPVIVQKYVEDNVISMGHAKALMSLNTENEKIRIAKKIIDKALSVRQTEEIVKARGKGRPVEAARKDENLLSIEEKLQHALGTKVRISHGKKRGRIEIQYYSNDDLERIVSIIQH